MSEYKADRPALLDIGASTEVWSRYAIELGNNGEEGDSRVSLMIAPAWYQREYLYLESIGEPILVGWLELGELRFANGADELVKSEPMAWIPPLLKPFQPWQLSRNA